MLITEPKPNGYVAYFSRVYSVVSESIVNTSQQVSCLGADLSSKIAFLNLKLHQGFTVSFLDPTAPTRALLFVDRCQIIVVGETLTMNILFSHLDNITLPAYAE